MKNSTYIGAASLLLLSLSVSLSGCVDPVHDQATRQLAAQLTMNELIPVCRDHVQYLITPYNGPSALVTPRLHTDGVPYAC